MNQEYIMDKILRSQVLSEDEQTWWDKNKDNKDVLRDFSFLKEMMNPLLVENKKLLKDQLISFEKSSKEKEVEHSLNEGRVFKLKPWMAIAATILVLIVSLVVVRSNSNTDHFNNYFDPYPSIVSPVVKGSQTSETKMDQILVSYQNGNYQIVIDEIESITNRNDTLSFYLANSLLSMDRSEEALPIFINLQGTENRFKKEASWYEAMAQLELDRRQEVKRKLEDILQDEAHPYYEEAQSLLRQIK